MVIGEKSEELRSHIIRAFAEAKLCLTLRRSRTRAIVALVFSASAKSWKITIAITKHGVDPALKPEQPLSSMQTSNA
jgi:hypothetical protein